MLAERPGFEPGVPVSQYTRLAGECLQPLGHLSVRRQSPPARAPAYPLKASSKGSRASESSGEGGIRTLEALARLAVFKTAAFDRSATSPRAPPTPASAGRVAEAAAGAAGFGQEIPPHAVLVFEVELLAVSGRDPAEKGQAYR